MAIYTDAAEEAVIMADIVFGATAFKKDHTNAGPSGGSG